MDPEIVVARADASQFERVGGFVHELLDELYPEVGYQRSDLTKAAQRLLASHEGVWAFLATTSDQLDVGVITLNECAAIYAGGCFGEIAELYVVPEFRSKRVGTLLIEAAVALGRERGWPNIEVGAPSVPAWQRTVDFYLRHGFEEVGPRLDLVVPADE